MLHVSLSFWTLIILCVLEAFQTLRVVFVLHAGSTYFSNRRNA